MDLGSIFLILAVLILVILFVSRPLLQKSGRMVTESEQNISSLMAERDRVLDALQELDFDYKLGKIPEEDYPTQRSRLLSRGADVLKQLDTIEPNGKRPERQVMVETVGAESTGGSPLPTKRMVPVADADDELEALIATRRRDRKEITGGFCAQCGHPVQKSDKFCSKCGTTV